MKNGFLGMKKFKGVCTFVGGVVFGTAGIAVLASDEAKKVYTHCTAAGLRAKEKIMEKATLIQENASDVYADAKMINADKKMKKDAGIIEDTSEQNN